MCPDVKYVSYAVNYEPLHKTYDLVYFVLMFVNKCVL